MHFHKTLSLTAPLTTIEALFKMVDGGKAIGISVSWGLNDTKWPALLSVPSFWRVSACSGVILAVYLDGGLVGL